MRHTKYIVGIALAAGMLIPAATLSAQDLRYDYRDIHRDYGRVARMQADIAADRARLNEDIRCGRTGAAAYQARDLARDERALHAQMRDIRHDRRDIRRDNYWGR